MRDKRSRRYIKRGVVTLSLVLFGAYLVHPKMLPFSSYQIVAHGLGGLEENKRVTNSLEAMEYNYANGTRLFEVDLIETSDGELVARHDWFPYLYELLEQPIFAELGLTLSPEEIAESQEEIILSVDRFKTLPIHDTYTPLTFDDILKLMKRYPDIYIITDIKTNELEDAKRVFQKIVNAVKEQNPYLLQRIIPQTYNQETYEALSEIHDFENVFYTLYMETSSIDDILEFCIEKDIEGVVMPISYFSPEFISRLNELGIASYVHTMNTEEEMTYYLSNGVTGIYSDYFTEDELDVLQKEMNQKK